MKRKYKSHNFFNRSIFFSGGISSNERLLREFMSWFLWICGPIVWWICGAELWWIFESAISGAAASWICLSCCLSCAYYHIIKSSSNKKKNTFWTKVCCSLWDAIHNNTSVPYVLRLGLIPKIKNKRNSVFKLPGSKAKI